MPKKEKFLAAETVSNYKNKARRRGLTEIQNFHRPAEVGFAPLAATARLRLRCELSQTLRQTSLVTQAIQVKTSQAFSYQKNYYSRTTKKSSLITIQLGNN